MPRTCIPYTIALTALWICTGCDKPEPPPAAVSEPVVSARPVASVPAAVTESVVASAEPPKPVEPPPVPGPAAIAAGASGTLTVSPNPVLTCDKTGVGVANVKWTIKGTKYAEIRMDSVDGTLFVATNKNSSQKTGPWVRKGTTFYLLNGGDKLAEQIMARVTADTVGGGPCP